MGGIDESVSPRARLAAEDEGITLDELRLATRNRGMPLEMLDHDLTPDGLHYLLVHYDIPTVDPSAWRLQVDGHVHQPLSLGLAELHDRAHVTHTVTMECAGNGRARLQPRPISQPWLDEAVGTAAWTGVPLAAVLAEARPRQGAVDVAFTGADHGVERGVEQDYQRGLSLDAASSPEVLLAHTMNGLPLPPQHGAPLRLIVPGWYGMAQVKWLTRITVLDRAFDGYQNVTAYRISTDPDDRGRPVTRIQPRALLRPPGFPDFQTRTRVLDVGRHRLTGRAWSGLATVDRVEVSVDGGSTWSDADLDPPLGRFAWRGWHWTWSVDRPGRYELCARASDADGNTQPLEQRWNRQAMANNHVQRVAVSVRPA
ncbi:sulfite oxidase [Microlunatus panaciterrae]|nr:sulfite oxidase [Microlunatus panaciterrae]